jgi:hypothetical protein
LLETFGSKIGSTTGLLITGSTIALGFSSIKKSLLSIIYNYDR